MNTQEACNILGVKSGASKEEVDKAFRKKAALTHPDINKSKSAEGDFKKLNQAHQFLKEHGTQPQTVNVHFSAGGFDEIDEILHRQAVNNAFRDMVSGVGFGKFGVREQRVEFGTLEHKGKIIISFEESILGCEKEINYSRKLKCDLCNNGTVASGPKELCPKCAGKKTRVYPGQDKELPCTACKASGYVQKKIMCNTCRGTGVVNMEDSALVKMPPGVGGTQKVRLPGRGDYYPKYGACVDAMFNVVVSPHREFYRERDDVVSMIDIDLLDALKGVSKRVSTVKGDKTLKIKAGVHHKDSIQVKGFGVPPDGSHVFIVNVKYPENIDALIKALEETEEEPEVITGDEGE
jgi:molecular chaperone DnaJ